MGVNGTPVLFRHVLVLQEHHHGLCIYISFACELDKVCMSLMFIVTVAEPFLLTTCITVLLKRILLKYLKLFLFYKNVLKRFKLKMSI
jgi:hypothetical protein